MTAPWAEGGGALTPEEPLWYWMAERQVIWESRQAGNPKPWTDDPILQRFRFCNVFRELDTVTQWISKHVRERFAHSDHLWFMLAIARTFNHPSTLAELMDSSGCWPSHPRFSPRHMTEVLQHRKQRGDQVYTGAYMIRAESDRTKPWFSWTKQKYISEVVLGRLWEDRDVLAPALERTNRLEAAWEMLAKQRRYIGWGPFMSYEWVTDLRWTRYLEGAQDIGTWANPGPGALRGLRRLSHPEGKLAGTAPISPTVAIKKMQRLLKMAPHHFPFRLGLEMRDIEHSLCETDKYLRVYHGEGRPRAVYNGR